MTAKSHRCCPRYTVAKGDLLSTPRFALSWLLNQSSLSHIVEYSIVVVVDVNWGPWTQGCRSLMAIVDGVFFGSWSFAGVTACLGLRKLSRNGPRR